MQELPEDTTDVHTADGRPATRAAALVRLGRMLCADAEQFNEQDAQAMAQAAAAAQADILFRAIENVVQNREQPPTKIILSGHGEFLAKRVFEKLQWPFEVVSLQEEIGAAASRCAAAHALAVLMREESSA